MPTMSFICVYDCTNLHIDNIYANDVIQINDNNVCVFTIVISNNDHNDVSIAKDFDYDCLYYSSMPKISSSLWHMRPGHTSSKLSLMF